MKCRAVVYILLLCIQVITMQPMSLPEKNIADQANSIFKNNFQEQLSIIRRNLDQAIAHAQKTSGEFRTKNASKAYWLNTFDTIREDAVLQTHQVIQQKSSNQKCVSVAQIGDTNGAVMELNKLLSNDRHVTVVDIHKAKPRSLDVVYAPHTLYSNMESIFRSAQDMLQNEEIDTIKNSLLFKGFDSLNEGGVFLVTLLSGPNIQDFTNLLLGKHDLKLSVQDPFDAPSLKIFNNLETFLRCLDIFKTRYERMTGKTIVSEVHFKMLSIPLKSFCQEYIQQNPELLTLDPLEREQFVRLLSIFNVNTDIRCLAITIRMSVKQQDPKVALRSFKPIDVTIKTTTNDISNEISLGQQNLYKQIQNLSGSELSMPYIKDADGAAQLKALKPVLGRKTLNFVEIGGGRGETNAVLKAVKDTGLTIHLLNVEPHKPFAQPYIEAHHAVGIPDVHVLEKTAQQVTAADILSYFGGKKVDVVFASHAFYFLLGDLHKALHNPKLPLNQHPLWKYLEVLRDDGVLVITLQSGAGARLFRNALQGNHGLSAPTTAVTDETVSLLSSFGNMETFLRAFDVFAELYKQQTGKNISIKMHYDIANVPLGGFVIGRDLATGGIVVHNPKGQDTDPAWIAPNMMDFYGNWKEQQLLATLTLEKAKKMSSDELKKLGLENPTEEMISAKRNLAITTQATFLHILPVFAPAMINMQHPNITLEITVQP